MSRRRASALTVACALSSAALPGCHLQQRAAEKMIDPGLRARGEALERARLDQRGARGMKLGPYEVRDVEVKERAVSVDGTLFSSVVPGRPVREYMLKMRFELPGARAWRARCTGQRRQSVDADFAAAASESRDDVAVRCELDRGPGRGAWEFTAEGTLADNVGGVLRPLPAEPEAEGGEAPAREDARASHSVEVLLWFKLWRVIERPLPAAVAHVRRGDRAVVAMILERPERAWVAADLEDEERELSLALLLALRYLPIGFDEL